MTMTWALNPVNNDLIIDRNGKFQVITGAMEVRQRIIVTLLHDYQEYFLNVPGGTPWHELILGSKDLATTSSLLKQIIFAVPNVVNILSFNISISNRMVTISTRVQVNGLDGNDIVNIITDLSNQINLLALNDNHIYLIDDKGRYLINENSAGNFLTE